MTDPLETRPSKLDVQRRLAVDSLKCCPLCDAVNAISNEECFVCGWQGKFEHDPYRVEAGLGELLSQCPELVDALQECPTAEPNVFQRFQMWLRRVFRRRVDYRV